MQQVRREIADEIGGERLEGLLSVRNLRDQFDTEAGSRQAVDGLPLRCSRGEVLSIVGESGSGKSGRTSLSVMGLLGVRRRRSRRMERVEGEDLLRCRTRPACARSGASRSR